VPTLLTAAALPLLGHPASPAPRIPNTDADSGDQQKTAKPIAALANKDR
jgi:hypothetical protein